MQHQNDQRPISTYDNLGATNNTPVPKNFAGESCDNNYSKCRQPLSSDDNESSRLRCDPAMSGNKNIATATATTTTTTDAALNETSHSIAAVKAALSDAKSKFFGINNCDKLDAPAPTSATSYESPIKPEPKYQNVPQPRRAPVSPETSSLQAMKAPPTVAQRYGATYEQIPLSDLDALQPLQAVYMSTTVPQNMKGMKIAGRHTPTRNSLRHSRMIVVNNKNYDSIQETYSTHIRNLNLSRQLLILQLAIGLLIVGLAIWILILAPSASILINPYLSGLSLLLASIAGLILLGRERRAEYHRTHNNCYKVLLVESYVFSALALIFCCLALVCAAIEFVELQSTSAPTDGSCGPATSSLLSFRNCTCLTEQQQTATPDGYVEDGTGNVDSGNSYRETCEAIRGEWKYVLGFSMALNAVGIIATFFYITIFIYCHHSSRKHLNTSV